MGKIDWQGYPKILMILGRYLVFWAILLPLSFTNQRASHRDKNPKTAESPEALRPSMGATRKPMAAPRIISRIGNTYIKKQALRSEVVSKLRTIRSPTLAPALLRASTSISARPPKALQEPLALQDIQAPVLEVFTKAVLVLEPIFITTPCSVAIKYSDLMDGN